MKSLAEFGGDHDGTFHRVSLGEIVGLLDSLIDDEAERIESGGVNISGRGRSAKRLDLVESAKDLLKQALNL